MPSTILRLALLGALAGGPALAQPADGRPPAAPRDDTAGATAPLPGSQSGVLQPGANSFTADQARRRIEAAGFTSPELLGLDAEGIWRARAMRDGRPVTVGLDYQGNVAALR